MKLEVVGRVFISFNVKAETGLHIGGSSTGIEIGGVDNPVIRDSLTNAPFIPGSSLKGKIRSLVEKQLGLIPNHPIGKVKIHVCKDKNQYRNCPVCQVFGVPAEVGFNFPTRLLVRDIMLSKESVDSFESLSLDRPYSEVKTEVAIDRVTSAASPRQVERVPAGAVFGPGEMVYTIYSSDDDGCDTKKDVDHLGTLFEGMTLLEHDYLGGMGSRGSGKVAFQNLKVALRKRGDYFAEPATIREFPNLEKLMAEKDALLNQIRASLGL